MGDQSGWCTIESDPGVFTELLSAIGVHNAQVDEIYALDRESLQAYGNVHGVVFLFKYRPNEHESAAKRDGNIVDAPDGLFFANQTIRNACATQAILSIVLNASVELGPDLQTFKDFCGPLDAMTRGMVLSNSETIRNAHNSFNVQQALVVDDPTGQKEDAFHFVSYIPWGGKVYELDGLQQGPRELGTLGEGEEWMDVVVRELQGRIAEYQGSEIRFNVMVVVEDQRRRLRKMVHEAREDSDRPELEERLHREEDKVGRWKVENERRRWNFMPLMMDLLKLVAKTGHAEQMIEDITAKKKEVYERAVRESKDKEKKDKEQRQESV